MADEQTSETQKRTELAEDRTILANERTFAGWMRSSLACIAIAIGFHALFSKVEPAWVPRAIATAFLLLAVVVVVLAERRAAAVMRRLDPHVVKTAAPINLRLFTAIITAGALALTGAIWLLRFG
jgi:putative membrane protein